MPFSSCPCCSTDVSMTETEQQQSRSLRRRTPVVYVHVQLLGAYICSVLFLGKLNSTLYCAIDRSIYGARTGSFYFVSVGYRSDARCARHYQQGNPVRLQSWLCYASVGLRRKPCACRRCPNSMYLSIHRGGSGNISRRSTSSKQAARLRQRACPAGLFRAPYR